MNHTFAPLYEELLRYVNNVKGNYHVPGHKQGSAFDRIGRERFEQILQIDLTEVATLDDLHDPTGVIEEAQNLAADAFFADKTLFLVGGTTSGILASILTVCRPGDEILIQRTCHQSVYHGCLFAGAKPITMPVKIDKSTGLEEKITVTYIDDLLQKHPSIKGVVITSPSYYGLIQPVSEFVSLCHSYEVPLIVDEAHGAHLGFHGKLSPSAMQVGADIAIQSTHKMLTSMTMSSMMHIKGGKIDVNEVRRWLKMIQSSSPSYPLLASLDLTRRYMVEHGKTKIEEVLRGLATLRKKIRTLRYLHEVAYDNDYDPFKLIVASQRVSGFELQGKLEQMGHFAELADEQKVLFVFSIGTTNQHIIKCYECLEKIDRDLSMCSKSLARPTDLLAEYGLPITYIDRIRAGRYTRIPLEDAEGEITAEMITPYPPGIPYLLPGERITNEAIAYLLHFKGKVRGLTNSSSSPYICVLQ